MNNGITKEELVKEMREAGLALILAEGNLKALEQRAEQLRVECAGTRKEVSDARDRLAGVLQSLSAEANN